MARGCCRNAQTDKHPRKHRNDLKGHYNIPTKRTFVHESRDKGIPEDSNKSGYCSCMSRSISQVACSIGRWCHWTLTTGIALERNCLTSLAPRWLSLKWRILERCISFLEWRLNNSKMTYSFVRESMQKELWGDLEWTIAKVWAHLWIKGEANEGWWCWTSTRRKLQKLDRMFDVSYSNKAWCTVCCKCTIPIFEFS